MDMRQGLWRRLLRNPYRRLTLKALTVPMPLRWWRKWARVLWSTRQWPRLRRVGIAARLYRHAGMQTLSIAVDAAWRERRFGSEMEAARSFARSHNAGIARRCAGARERIAELRQRVIELQGAG